MTVVAGNPARFIKKSINHTKRLKQIHEKIVIAIDSFKGCLTSAEAGEAAAQGVHAACPECRTIVLPVADGGEGMLDVLLAASNGKRITVRAHDPLMQPCDASYGISGDGNTAFVEMAAISGLPLVPADKRNPMKPPPSERAN